jgi:hypothetical protein
MNWIAFSDQDAPNINPVQNNQRVVCARIRVCEKDDGTQWKIVDWVHIVSGRGISDKFNKNSCALSSHGIRSIWGGYCMFDLDQATHWAVIELPVTNDELV